MDTKNLDKMENTLKSFIKKKTIESNKIRVLDKLISDCKNEEVKILSNSLISLNEQRTIFGGIRNIIEITDVMKDHLISAHSKGENPTTAELCLEIMPIMKNVLSEYREYVKSNFNKEKVNKILILSDELRRTARRKGFKRDFSKELDSIGLSDKTKIQFMEEFKDNLKVIFHEYEDSD